MTTPVQEQGHDYPAIGATVTIRGLVSTQYLHRNQTMIVRWSEFWEAMADYGYIAPMNVEDNPDADRVFPTLRQVTDLIAAYATTQPGERVLAIRAVGDTLYVRVGTSVELSREYPVVVPNWAAINQSVAAAAQSAADAAASASAAQTSSENAQADVNAAANAAAQSVRDQLQAYTTQSGTNATNATNAATRAESAATRAENAADTVDVQLASPTQVGIVKLAGDLAGTANAPTVPELSSKYVKPGTGIPLTDLTTGVQTSLGRADSAYQKPGSGIPGSDLAAAVNTLLTAAGTAYQKPSPGIPKADLIAAVQASLNLADVSLQAPAAGWKFVVITEAAYQALATKDAKTVYFRTA